ncbi:type II secretory pathway component HofQ [Silvibacterium bohemicum]|uniref:Type II secretory pathway component HofQ n=1 Tax=Silvibacterium bohemicum TaxID=1577686 RepID=A0A841K0D6_9BACT|nr:hypothetical protein [Silvibacterium bohemicum]MBB6147223.1 type II secretory pathway component HofQ [Silvibacterium bohemicum]
MPGAYQRLLRLRALFEEAARADLERQVARTKIIEEAGRRQAGAEQKLLRESIAPLLAPQKLLVQETLEESERRSLAGRAREASLVRRHQLERIASWEEQHMLLLREEFLARRKERQQVEKIEQGMALQRRFEAARREQRALDDWYAASRSRPRR